MPGIFEKFPACKIFFRNYLATIFLKKFPEIFSSVFFEKIPENPGDEKNSYQKFFLNSKKNVNPAGTVRLLRFPGHGHCADR
jgi:hypothetical protein